MKYQALLSLLLTFALASPVTYANDLPDLGESSHVYLTDKQEQTLARSIMQEIYADPHYLDDPVIESYLNDLGYRLVSHSPGNKRAFDFFVLQDPTVNAFALPGAHIGVHTGLILTADNESELAAVLAHEISHVNQNHLYRMIANQEKSFWPTMAALAVAILASRSNPNVGSAAIAGSQALSMQNQLSYTRDFEREADRMGFDVLENAGFDPHAMASFFERLQRANRLYETNAPAYLRDHPLTSERIADIESRLENVPYKQYQDSSEFQLVRARIKSMDGTPQDAIALFQGQLREKKYSSEAAAVYGLGLAYLRANQVDAAEKTAEKLAKLGESPPVSLLLADVAAKSGNLDLALTRYRAGLSRYPAYRPLVYGYAKALLEGHRAQEALNFLKAKTVARSDDLRLWKLLGRTHAMLGQRLASHRATAEALALSGDLRSAIEQLNLGLKAGDGDFYDMSSTEARRKEWQAILAEQAKK
ncbi:MAG TPA: M48 family metalloprotease [Thiobacillaceae bacterium]|nr:M48 family metalloprotease [Thiobacillaceae bacterium]